MPTNRGMPGGRPIDREDETRLDREAAARAKQGDLSALHFLYVRFADDVCAEVASIVHNRREAEDITQTVFGRLATAIQRYESRDVPFTTWILDAARNAALEYLQRGGWLPSSRRR
jgi:RNA polymerase sigma-70 factor, ECF subfamily